VVHLAAAFLPTAPFNAALNSFVAEDHLLGGVANFLLPLPSAGFLPSLLREGVAADRNPSLHPR
jgi:hypothetical protein